jgi:hypothetical protein
VRTLGRYGVDNHAYYKTLLLKIGGPGSKDSYTVTEGSVSSGKARQAIENYEKGTIAESRYDTVEVKTISSRVTGTFCKFGDMFGVDLGEGWLIPIKRDTETYNTSPTFSMMSSMENEAEAEMDRAEILGISSLDDVVRILTNVENTSMNTKDATSLLKTFYNLLRVIRRNNKMNRVKESVLNYVALRTIAGEDFFTNQLRSVLEAAGPELPDADEEYDPEMDDYLSAIASRAGINMLDESESMPSPEAI